METQIKAALQTLVDGLLPGARIKGLAPLSEARPEQADELMFPPAAESLRESLAASLSNAEKKLAALIQTVGCKAEMRVEHELVTQAARAIVDETKADLLVIGRAAKGLGRLRSNAYALIRESPCPVISV